MLISCSFKNLFSFEKLTTFSMVAGKAKYCSERVAKLKDDLNLLKFSAIYGANASGKSNFIKSIRELGRLIIFGPHKYKKGYGFAGNSEPSYFEIDLNIEDSNYKYGFEYSYVTNRFVSEWLYKLQANSEILIYERDIINSTFKLEGNLAKEDEERLKVYKNDLLGDGETLFLSFVHQLNPELVSSIFNEMKSVIEWFEFEFEVVFPDSALDVGYYYSDKKRIDSLSKLMKEFGTGIEALDYVRLRDDEVIQLFSSKLIEDITKNLTEDNDRIGLLRPSKGNRAPTFIVKFDKKTKTIDFSKIVFAHQIGGKRVLFDASQESDGTLRLLELSAILLSGPEDMTVFVDEFDRCLHPLVVIHFIKQYLKKVANSKCRWQLIITTHESLLMDLNMIRRDEIWFIEKLNNTSEMYSLEDFQVRNDARPNKSYIEGRYGAVPLFQDALGVLADEN